MQFLYRIVFTYKGISYYFEFESTQNLNESWSTKYDDPIIFSMIEKYLKDHDLWEDGIFPHHVYVFNKEGDFLRFIESFYPSI